MHEVEDETIGTGVPVLLRIRNSFQWRHGREQSLPQGGRNEVVRLPDPLRRANLELNPRKLRCTVLAGDKPHFYPSLWVTQRRVSMELVEHVVDLDTKVRKVEPGGSRITRLYHGGGRIPRGSPKVFLVLAWQSFFSPILNDGRIFHLLPPIRFFSDTIRERTYQQVSDLAKSCQELSAAPGKLTALGCSFPCPSK